MHQLFVRKTYQFVLFSMIFLSSSAYASGWVDSGWVDLEQGQEKQALQHWQEGVNQLDDKQLLIVLGLSHKLQAAISLARQAGRQESAFIVQAPFKDEIVYYVLSSRLASLHSVTRQLQLTTLRKAVGVVGKLYSDSAIKFKSIESKRNVASTHKAGEVLSGKLASAGLKPKQFMISAFLFKGNTLISSSELKKHLKPFVGFGKTNSDLISAKKMIQAIYASHGYHIENIQSKKSNSIGVIKLLLTESSDNVSTVTAIKKTMPKKTKHAIQQSPPAFKKNTNNKSNLYEKKSEIKWLMLGNKTLKQNLKTLLDQHGWKLVWELEYDYLGGIDVRLQGSLSSMIDDIIAAYANRGVLLKVTWFEGNQVLLVQRVFSANALQ